MQKSWDFAAVDAGEKKKLAAELAVSEIVAGILLRRGLTERDTAERFLHVEKQPLYDAFLLKDMEKAVKRIETAIARQEKITVYGDYDVDGITATVVLLRTLRALGARTDFYIPDRETEDYGLNLRALEKISQTSSLLISVDCGIRAVTELQRLETALDVIITDHHVPGDSLPVAVAVIDPHRRDCPYPDKNLAGVGVAFKLCQALWQSAENTAFEADLDLVALGTVADIVPLLGENRRLVKCGLQQIQQTQILGLKELLQVCDLTGKKIEAGHVGFILAPRLNAAGRLARAGLGVELLLTQDPARAFALAKQLDDENTERQTLEKELLEKAERQLAGCDVSQSKVLVLAGEGWRKGVIGLVASRLVEKYYKPVVIISIQDGIGKGSCRSIRGFHMCDALTACQDILEGFGGHAQAAGLRILPENIDLLRSRLTQVAGQVLTEKDFIPVLDIAADLTVREVDDALMAQLACLEPYGMGNPRPIFASRKVHVLAARTMGREGMHLRLNLEQAGIQAAALAWNKGELAEKIAHKHMDIAFQPEFNSWQGRTTLQLKLQDLRLTELPEAAAEAYPDREIIGQMYLLLKRNKNAAGQLTWTLQEIAAKYTHCYPGTISPFHIKISIKILAELELISVRFSAAKIEICFRPAPKAKLNLRQSATFLAGLAQAAAAAR